jgi:hypothetical protein
MVYVTWFESWSGHRLCWFRHRTSIRTQTSASQPMLLSAICDPPPMLRLVVWRLSFERAVEYCTVRPQSQYSRIPAAEPSPPFWCEEFCERKEAFKQMSLYSGVMLRGWVVEAALSSLIFISRRARREGSSLQFGMLLCSQYTHFASNLGAGASKFN